MMEQSGFVKLSSGSLHYLKWGGGASLLLCFHGYGHSATVFKNLGVLLQNDFTIVSVDLPHHGRSAWTEGQSFTKEDISELIKDIMSAGGFHRVSLLGYSLGGRVCLSVVGLHPEMIDRLVLIAADGLVFDPLYFFVTRTKLGKGLFLHFLKDPSRYLRLLSPLRKAKLIDESRYKFVSRSLETPAHRALLRQVWTDMDRVVSRSEKIRDTIREWGISTDIFMGRYDRVIPLKYGRRFAQSLPMARLHVLDRGHALLDGHTLSLVAQCLTHSAC